MRDFFEYINGCEVIEYHKGTAKGKFLYFFLSYIPTLLMVVLMCLTLEKAYTMLRYEIDHTSVLLQYIALGVFILMMDVIARITKEKKVAEFQECCIIRYTGTLDEIDQYWIKEKYKMQEYGADGTWIAMEKKRRERT